MKTPQILLIRFLLTLLFTAPVLLSAQTGLLGSWKYASPAGEMIMNISATNIEINGQSFAYKAQGNVLMVTEEAGTIPYPYMIDGNQLALEFPGGMELVFTRSESGSAGGAAPQGGLPQSMARPQASGGQGAGAPALSGRWAFQSQQGNLILEFLSPEQLSFNGETTRYQLKDGLIQAMGDYGWIDYPYTLSQGTLTITFPDGSRIPFTRDASGAMNQQGRTQQGGNQQGAATPQSGDDSSWQLRGTLCSWAGSSNDYSSYSRTSKYTFDGQGNFRYGSEASFNSDAGLAYGGNPNSQGGTYKVRENLVILYYPTGEAIVMSVKMRQNSGMITELMYGQTLYATGLCE